MNNLSEKRHVQVRFLLGPAGTGKTFRCLEEIRSELKRDPEGPRLIFLAPKQATFQIERQLLSDPELNGYTRLQIFSFDRLAEFVTDVLGNSPREILSEEGRVMIIRALLAARQPELKTFRATARLPGFAQQLAALLREFQHQQLAPQRIEELVSDARGLSPALRNKLIDIGMIFRAYRERLRAHSLDDADSLLDVAAMALREAVAAKENGSAKQHTTPRFHLWLDGFAEMTPQELNLLEAFLPCCERATLAFCLEAEPSGEAASWLSLWTVVAQTYRSVREQVEHLDGADVRVEVLPRENIRSRFSTTPALSHLEANWSRPTPFAGDVANEIQLAACAGLEAEAVFAARAICRFVREGGRYRECAVLMRTLTGYHDIVRRVFTRYRIPFFVDRRDPVTHHPLAELTRFALRVAAYDWQRADWFGALKTGLVDANDAAIDELENEALAHGWERDQWNCELPREHGRAHRLESVRARVMPPFARLSTALSAPIDGKQLADAIRALWAELKIEDALERWAEDAREVAPVAASVHGSVREQLEAWLENVALAFATQSLPLTEWLPILESGLAGLTVGVIPPALDQVLVGTIDRSRNPDLRLCIVVGLNDTVFPAPPPPPPILTEREREQFSDVLARETKSIGLSRKDRLAHERYYGYIALTRSRERLVLTWSQADAKGHVLNPSPFISLVTRLFPNLKPVMFAEPDWREAEHFSEVAPHVIRANAPSHEPLLQWPEFAELIARANGVRAASSMSALSSDVVARLYENPFRTSVSALEQFAACPFKFFLSKGLGVEERIEFEVDARERGKFQHEILSEFHTRLTREGKQWRDHSEADAESLVREIGEEKLRTFGDGLFNSNAQRRFAAGLLIANLERLVATLVAWMKDYEFNPARVELAFGFAKDSLPGWEIDLGNGRSLVLCGRVDRVDLCPHPDGNGHLAVVIDYKSSGRKVDNTKLFHGIELQLLSYLGWLRQAAPKSLGSDTLTPAGVFYVGLKGHAKSASSRFDAVEDADELRRKMFQHAGRFDATWRGLFSSNNNKEQFNLGGRSDPCDPNVFAELVNDVEKHLRSFGHRILDGAIEIAPYRKGKEVACTHCEFFSVCRFDPWEQKYRSLAARPKVSAAPNLAKGGRAK